MPDEDNIHFYRRINREMVRISLNMENSTKESGRGRIPDLSAASRSSVAKIVETC